MEETIQIGVPLPDATAINQLHGGESLPVTVPDGEKTPRRVPVEVLKEYATGELNENVSRLARAVGYNNSPVAIRRKRKDVTSGHLEAYGNISYLRELPNTLGLGCYLVEDDLTMKKLSPSNHYQFADGTPANLDGSMGQYMFCWKAFFYAFWEDETHEYEAVSAYPILGQDNYYIPRGGTSALGAACMDRDTNTLCSVVNESPRYRGGRNIAERDGQYNTLLGKVSSGHSIQTASEAARKRGKGWEASWFITNRAVEILYRIIMGEQSCQTPVNPEKTPEGLFQGGTGAGATSCGSWWSDADKFNYSPFVPTSFGCELGDYTGEKKYDIMGEGGVKLSTQPIPFFFGLKNFYGHMGNIEGGWIIKNLPDGSKEFYVEESMANHHYSTTEGMLLAGTIGPAPSAGWTYPTKLNMNYLCGSPAAYGGSTGQHYGDGFYNPNETSGLRGAFRRGSASYGSNAGLVCLYGSSAVLYASTHWSSPLCFLAEDVAPLPKKY